MISNRMIDGAGAVAAKTARACDCCIRKRARWYCAADDAFLCQVCDGSVHSANPLARRHKRVRLKTASLKPSSDQPSCIPSWHRGLKRKARTPRHGKQHNSKPYDHEGKVIVLKKNWPLVVPEIGAEDNTSHEEDNDEDQLVYRVPIFDPFVVELCSSTATSNGLIGAANHTSDAIREEPKPIQSILSSDDVHDADGSSPCGFLPSDLDLAEFEVDVQTLLGKGLDGESYGIEDLGLLDCHERNSNIALDCSVNGGGGGGGGDDGAGGGSSGGTAIKAEEGEEGKRGEEIATRASKCYLETEIEPFELTFDYNDYPTACCNEEDVKVGLTEAVAREQEDGGGNTDGENKKWKISLKLDYEAISTAWASQASPWINGKRPQISPDDCWPHSVVVRGSEEANLPNGQMAAVAGAGGQQQEAAAAATVGDGGREARVSRYREKRRTRLFSKKIRYEVRKLNAEKRPRVKGRFVKRTSSFAPTATPFPHHT